MVTYFMKFKLDKRYLLSDFYVRYSVPTEKKLAIAQTRKFV